MKTLGLMPDGRTVEAYIDDLNRLLDAIQRGVPPTDDQLAAAPLIHSWTVQEVIELHGEGYRRIVGVFEGHPYIGAGCPGHTSPLLQLDRELRWARCRSRVYRLTDPLPLNWGRN